MRGTSELAIIAALQRLEPRDRAVLLLRDGLGFGAAEVADMLDATEAWGDEALVRARAIFEEWL